MLPRQRRVLCLRHLVLAQVERLRQRHLVEDFIRVTAALAQLVRRGAHPELARRHQHEGHRHPVGDLDLRFHLPAQVFRPRLLSPANVVGADAIGAVEGLGGRTDDIAPDGGRIARCRVGASDYSGGRVANATCRLILILLFGRFARGLDRRGRRLPEGLLMDQGQAWPQALCVRGPPASLPGQKRGTRPSSVLPFASPA